MKEVLILGAGYAGLRALKELQNHPQLHITLVNRQDYHYESTSLHEVAAGTQKPEHITYPIVDVLKNQDTFIKGEVAKILLAERKVQLADGKELTYDYLVIALGFRSETFGIPGAEIKALQMVDIPTAKAIHQHILEQLATYATTKDPDYLKIVVCGAGFTGIELLGALVEARPILAKIAGVSENKIELYCVEAMTRLLPMFSEELAAYGIQHLTDWGVKFLTGKPIVKIDTDTVVYKDTEETEAKLTAKTIIWTTGVSGSHVLDDPIFSAKRGRVLVTENLTHPSYDEVYIVGDVAASLDPITKRPYPTTAQIALKMGGYAAQDLLAQENHKKREKFVFHSLGTVCSIGNTHAFGVVGKAEVKGYPASFIKKAIMDRSLFETGGLKEALAKGRFDFYH